MRRFVMPVVNWATTVVINGQKNLEAIPGKHSIDTATYFEVCVFY
jgi:hypothetical protein